jgi:DNA-binding beta-propeller fold protein YncE
LKADLGGSSRLGEERPDPSVRSDGQLNQPSGIAVDASGNRYVADSGNRRVQKFNARLAIWESFGLIGPRTGARPHQQVPRGIAVDRNSGHIYVCVEGPVPQVIKFASNGREERRWGRSGPYQGEFRAPWGIAVDGEGNVFVVDRILHRVQKFSPTGGFLVMWGSLGDRYGQFNSPSGIAADKSDNIYVTDTKNHRVQKFDSYGRTLAEWNRPGQFMQPVGIAVDQAGDVYVTDTELHRIQKFNSRGEFLARWPSSGDAHAQLASPQGVTVDEAGKIYVADSENHRVQVFYPM